MHIIIYTTPTCSFCKQVKKYLENHGVSFTDIDVSADQEKTQEMIQKSGQMGVPVIDIDGEIIIGFDEDKLKQILKL